MVLSNCLNFALCWDGLCSHSKPNCPAGSAARQDKTSFYLGLIWTSCQKGGQLLLPASRRPKGPEFTKKGSSRRRPQSDWGRGKAAFLLSRQGMCWAESGGTASIAQQEPQPQASWPFPKSRNLSGWHTSWPPPWNVSARHKPRPPPYFWKRRAPALPEPIRAHPPDPKTHCSKQTESLWIQGRHSPANKNRQRDKRGSRVGKMSCIPRYD